MTKYRSWEEGGRKDTQNECLGAAEVEKAIDTQKEKLSRFTWKGCKWRSVRDTESWRFTTGWTAGLRIGELRLNVGGLVVSGSMTRRRKRVALGATKIRKIWRKLNGYRPGEFVSSCCKNGRGERSLLTKIRALDRGWLRLGELRLDVGDQSIRTSRLQTVIRNWNSMAWGQSNNSSGAGGLRYAVSTTCYVDAAMLGCRYDDGFWLWGWLPIRQSWEPYPNYIAKILQKQTSPLLDRPPLQAKITWEVLPRHIPQAESSSALNSVIA